MSHNTWLHKVSRILIVKPLIRSPVRPNHLTVLRLVAGIGAAAGFAKGDSPAIELGAVAFLFSILLDRADGDLARVTGRMSAFGHKLDLIGDALCNSLIFVGLGFGLRNSEYGFGAIIMGLIAGGAVTVILGLVVRIETLQGARAAELKNIGGFDTDDAMVLVPVLVLFGVKESLLLAAATVTPCFAIFFLIWF